MPEDFPEYPVASNLDNGLIVEAPVDATPRLRFGLHSGNGYLLLTPPRFNVGGRGLTPSGVRAAETERAPVFGDVIEHRAFLTYADAPHLRLEVVARSVDASPVVRFRFVLHADVPVRLSKTEGRDDLAYFALDPAGFHEGDFGAREVRFSEFNGLFHSFLPVEENLPAKEFAAGRRVMGPMLTFRDLDVRAPVALVAYEHGSQSPHAFLAYDLAGDGKVTLRAVKGNYCDGQEVGPGKPFETPWLQLAAVDGGEDDLAQAYREWVLKYQTPNAASRSPHVFYNSWNYQERVKHWQGRPYLADMNEARMLAEIDAAHEMGIDVFVIDTGWYEKTGDWRVSRERFPNGLGPIKAKLDGYGMKLGLWFNPTVAAVSSEMRKNHEDCLMTVNGRPHDPHPVWETEESQGLCLVSRYGDAFADELIRLNREVGVTYFKWDAVGQYGCDAPGHGHGDEHNTPEERRDAYAFLLGRAMTRVVDKVCAACPDAIVDFDITEGGRTVGLQFLSAGKYFLINNGPYAHEYQSPMPLGDAVPNPNLFFRPGPARAWICRAPLAYDRWIPSVLFLTHYLPDDTHREGWTLDQEVEAENQWIALASLVLGQNGVWGDLPAVSAAGRQRFGDTLRRYKRVAADVTAAYPVRSGQVGGSPEVHEKVNAETGRGVVSVFAASRGTYTYVTENRVEAEGVWHNDGVTVTLLPDGRARIDATFGRGQYAKLVIFGAE
jgi:alpha-galactosidase